MDWIWEHSGTIVLALGALFLVHLLFELDKRVKDLEAISEKLKHQVPNLDYKVRKLEEARAAENIERLNAKFSAGPSTDLQTLLDRLDTSAER